MRRPVLLTLAAVGGVIVLLGGTGIFAALSDSARSGTNSIETDALPPSADLRLAFAELVGEPQVLSCGPFSDNLASPMITVTGQEDSLHDVFYCVRNVGSRTIALDAFVEEFEESEPGCTGDEAIVDTTCGFGPGEIGDVAWVNYEDVPGCDPQMSVLRIDLALRNNQSEPAGLGGLAPGESRCYRAVINLRPSEDQRQLIQSDRLMWRFAWTGQA